MGWLLSSGHRGNERGKGTQIFLLSGQGLFCSRRRLQMRRAGGYPLQCLPLRMSKNLGTKEFFKSEREDKKKLTLKETKPEKKW